MTPLSLSVVIPAFNEEGALGELLHECMTTLSGLNIPFDITVVNDGSTDGTSSIIHDWMHRHPAHIFRADHAQRRGLAGAVETAFHSGKNDCVLLLHADGQYPPECIGECVRRIAECDCVVLVRRQKFYGPWRHLLSAGYRWVPRILFGVDLRDPGGAKCIRRELLERIPVVSAGVFRDPERIIRALHRGKTVVFLPVDIRPRRTGIAQGGRVKLAVQSLCDISRLWWQTAVLRKPW